jgi:hypothetical protein
LDNDCDGEIDEALIGPECGLQGVCAGAISECIGGQLLCTEESFGPYYEPEEVTCDGLDNDCDGMVDEYSCHIGQVCNYPDQCESGICAGGYCCSSSCDGLCKTCTNGNCVNFAAETDPLNQCFSGSGYCNGFGACV